MPIQPVASDCSSTRAVVAVRWLRSKTVMLSSPRNPPSKMLLPSRSTLLTHQAKLMSSLWKQRSRKARSALPRADAVHVVDPPHGPGVHRRIQIGELPLVGRESGRWDAGTARTAARQSCSLAYCGVDEREGDAVERQVPGGEPGIFPLVGHGHDPHRIEVPPVLVANRAPRCRRRAAGIVAVEPVLHVEDIALLGPEQPGQGLALDPPLVFVGLRRVDRVVEVVGLGPPRCNQCRRPRPAAPAIAASSERRNRSTADPPGGTASKR